MSVVTRSNARDDVRETLAAIKKVEELLRNVEAGDDQASGEQKGKLTDTRLRKMLHIALSEDLYESFRLKLRYLVARNRDRKKKDLEKFVNRFLSYVEEESDLNKRMARARKTLEYAVIVFYSRRLDQGGGSTASSHQTTPSRKV